MKDSKSSNGFDLLPSLLFLGSGSYVCYESVIPVTLESNLGLWYNYIVGPAPSKDILRLTYLFFSRSTFSIASEILNLGISKGSPLLLIAGGAPYREGSILRCCVAKFVPTNGFGEPTMLVQPYLLDKVAKWPVIKAVGWFCIGC